MITLLIDALQQCLIFLPLTIGIYLTYRIVNITDLTVGGSYVIGAAVFARLLTSGCSQLTAIMAALCAGMLAGLGVYALQKFAKINALIASILAVFMLFSINFAIMGEPNISLLSNATFLNTLQIKSTTTLNLFLLGFSAVLITAIALLLKSKFGLRLRAYGSNPTLLNRLGHRSTGYLAFGLVFSNMLAALCGVMTAQMNGYADIHMGQGMALTAIGAVVIGVQLVRSLFLHRKQFYATLELISCVLGAYLYFLILHLFLAFNINPIYLKLCLGLLLAICLSTAHYSRERGQQYENTITT